jgi:hypothetical protein
MSEDDAAIHYLRGYDDGQEFVLALMESFINHSIIVGVEPEYIRAVEEMLEDIKNTLDDMTPN